MNRPTRARNVEEALADRIDACIDELTRRVFVPSLIARFDDVTLVAALAEHLGVALRMLIEQRDMPPEQVNRIIEHIRATAFDTLPDERRN